MQKDDAVRLRHMLEAAREALSFAQGRTRRDLDTDRMLTFSLVKAIEILGEAAARTSNDLRSQHPSIPWPQITAMRNRLIHAYFDINLDRIRDTVTDDLPPLVAEARTNHFDLIVAVEVIWPRRSNQAGCYDR